MLQRRANCYVTGGMIKDCKAWSSGGGISTVMAGGDNDDKVRDDDLVTTILVNNVSFTGGNIWERLLVGPYFNVNLINVSDFNLSSAGVVWRRRLCGKGEYLSASNFCEQCPSYQYSTVEEYPGHSERQCWDAPNSAYAPGGAVLVPLSGGRWTLCGGRVGAWQSLRACAHARTLPRLVNYPLAMPSAAPHGA
jgi:hypothetical protein